MGVAGSGKTTIGRLLADRTGWTFHDADDYHGADNLAKMQRGIPLTDEDRVPWLKALRREVVEPSLGSGQPTVLACSALKAAYREYLGAADPRVKVIYLKGDPPLIRERVARRAGHFMGAEMLRSQFEVLEEPENAVVVDVAAAPDEIVDTIMRTIGWPETR